MVNERGNGGFHEQWYSPHRLSLMGGFDIWRSNAIRKCCMASRSNRKLLSPLPKGRESDGKKVYDYCQYGDGWDERENSKCLMCRKKAAKGYVGVGHMSVGSKV